MKEIVSLKRVLLGLACAGALNGLAFAAQARIPAALGNLPLYFEAVSGPANHSAKFVARGSDYQFLISPAEVQFTLEKADAASQKISLRTVRMRFVGAGSQAQIHGADELPGKINYLVGNNPAQWCTGVPTFGRVQVDQLYTGVNLVYYGNQRQLEYDFTLAPGADPAAIGIRFDGVDKTSVGSQGELILTVGKNEIVQRAPVIYQTIGGARKIINGGYRILDRHTVAFTIGQFDHKLPLVIDPILSFSTYFGGYSGDIAWAVALDTNDGSIYIAGQTLSRTFYYTPGAFQTNFAGGGITGDAFVAKFNNTAQRLVYFTYLGGSGNDEATSIAIDNAGDTYVTGFTDSKNFPVTNSIPGGVQGLPNSTNISGTFNPGLGAYPVDAFVTELNPSGSNLVYSTYLGGSGQDGGYGIAVDSSGNAYITGFSYSTNFPVTPDAFQKTLQVTNWAYQTYYNANAFVTEISTAGTNLLYSSYFGGTNYDTGESIAVDNSNYIYVTGFTASTNFPTTNAILQTLVQTNLSGTNLVLTTNFFDGYLLNGSTNTTAFPDDAFVTKFAPGFTSLVYSTFIGGTNNDEANHVAVDASGNAYVTGWTVSTNFPNTATSVAGLYNGLANNAGNPYITNAFLTKITWNGTNAAIGYSAVFGGTGLGIDVGQSVALDPAGDAFVAGSSSTGNFPITNTPALLGTANAGGSDAFVIGFNTNCSAILYSGYLGGSGNDYGYGIAVDTQTNAYIAGQTASANFPTFYPFQASFKGASDAFLAKIGWVNQAPEFTTEPTNQAVKVGSTVSLVSTVTGTSPLTYQWQEQGTNLTWTNLVNGGTNLSGFGTHITGATNATLTISDPQTNDSGSFRIIVTNYAGSVTSAVAVLTVTNAATVLTTQPASQTVGVGSTVTFSVGGSAQPPYSLQWLKDGTNLMNGTNISGSIISGATNIPLTIRNVQTNDAGIYWLVISNVWGVLASSNATLTVVSFPTILTPPTSQTVGLGSTVSFAVNAVGSAPLSYQWQLNGVNLANSGHISGGVTNSVLTFTDVQTNNDGDYSVVVTNSFGSVTSSPPAILTVLTVPTFMSITAGTNGSFIFSGTGGTNGGSYFVYASTNLALPLSQWQAILVSGSPKFGSQGQFVFTNTPPANLSQRFYMLVLPSP